MKKTLALLLCLAMLFTALSFNVFAADKPSVTVVTHEATASGETSFAISLANFDSLKGYDLVIEGDSGVHIKSASALNAKTALKAGVNYTITDNKLHIVELSSKATGDIITVTADVNVDGASHTIRVTACDLAKSKDALYATTEYTLSADATIAPYKAPKEETVTESKVVEQDTVEAGYFVPYGAVFTGESNAPAYVKKEADGSFNVAAGTVVKAFKLPEGGFGTFGVSDSAVATKPAKQFGNVDTNYSASKKYGTLVIAGDWAGFRDWYLSNKAYSDAELVSKIYAAFNAANPATEGVREYDFVSFEAGESAIKVYNVDQKNWMWKSANALEYAVRIFGLTSGTEYAAVAYNVDGSTVNFAKEIKSVQYAA